MFETEKFRIGGHDWIYRESQEITSAPKAPVAVGILYADVHCKACNHTWRASSYGEGKLSPVLGGVIIECPECGQSEMIRGARFKQADNNESSE